MSQWLRSNQNLQKQVKRVFGFRCWRSKRFSRTIYIFFLTVGQNNCWNKIPLVWMSNLKSKYWINSRQHVCFAMLMWVSKFFNLAFFSSHGGSRIDAFLFIYLCMDSRWPEIFPEIRKIHRLYKLPFELNCSVVFFFQRI